MKDLILAFLLLPSLLVAQTRSVLPKSLILTHVTVIDATGSPAKLDMTVLIRDHRIIAIDRTSALSPNDTEVVDATGKFLVPGLWDMHVHTGRGDVFFPLYIANGVTGVRDMGGDLEDPSGELSSLSALCTAESLA